MYSTCSGLKNQYQSWLVFTSFFVNFQYSGQYISFHALTFAMSLGICYKPRATYLVVIEGTWSWSANRTWMDRCWGLLSCLSCARTSTSNIPRMTTPEHISPESANFLSSEQYVVSIDWPALIRHVYNWTCEGHLWPEGPTHNADTKKPPGPQHEVTGGVEADP